MPRSERCSLVFHWSFTGLSLHLCARSASLRGPQEDPEADPVPGGEEAEARRGRQRQGPNDRLLQQGLSFIALHRLSLCFHRLTLPFTAILQIKTAKLVTDTLRKQVRERGTALPCASAVVLPKTDAFAVRCCRARPSRCWSVQSARATGTRRWMASGLGR